MFSEQARQVYKYHNGEKEVFADPLEIERKVDAFLDDQTTKIITDQAEGRDVDPVMAFEATNKLIAVIRKAFKMAPWDETTGKGAMEAHCLEAWDGWCDMMDQKKSPPVETPTSSQPTVGPQAA